MSSDNNKEKIKAIKETIDVTKKNIINNLDKVLERGEKIDVICEHSELLSEQSINFNYKAKVLRKTMMLKNLALCFAIIISLAIVILIIVMSICGITFSQCKK
jgi:vesicle-associated membrane protein 7